MKKLLFTLLLFPLTLFGQRAYYFSNDGDDNTGDGTIGNPYATITKANALQPTLSLIGDSLLFARADTFSISALNLLKSGTGSNKFIIGAYGEGDDPIFTSLEAVTFTAYNDSVDFAVIAVQSYPRYILINGDWQAMGRYPNSTYLTYTSFVTNTQITITGLGDSPNWTGANAVIRKNDYTLDRTVITAHSGDVLTYSNLGSSSNGTANYGCFIQNDYRTLDSFGEWFYDGDTLFIYSGTEDISTYTVEVPTFDNLIYGYASNGVDYVTIKDIHFKGSGRDAISLYQYSDYIIIQDCQFEFSGENAINFVNQIRYAIVDGNTINKSIKAGIYIVSSNSDTIRNNVIRNSGMILGASTSATQNDGLYYNASDNFTVQYNEVDSSAYNGIFVNGNGYLVKNNYVTNSLLLLNDGAGIYTNNRTHTGREISDNIVINVFGNNSGTASTTRRWARGIYLDTSASGITVTGNTVQGAGDFGFMNGGGSDNIWLNNTAYDNKEGGIFIQDYASIPGSAGVRIEDLTIKHNKFVGKSVSENTMRVYVGSAYIDAAILVSDSNYIMRPVAEGTTVNINTAMNTLAQWRTFSGHDANSTVSPINLSDDSKITFIYNPENKDSTFSLTDKLTIDGDKFSGDTTLTAYSSAIFFVDPAPTPPDPADVVIDSIYTATRKHMFVYSNALSDGGDAITQRGVVYSTVGAPTVDSTKVISGTGTGTFATRIDNMLKLTTYYIRSYAINSVDTAYSDTYIVTTPEYNYLTNKAGKLLTDKSGKLIKYDPAVDVPHELTLEDSVNLLLADEYTKGWYHFGTVTKDVNDSVTVWDDQSANENDLTYYNTKPNYTATGILLNGTNQSIGTVLDTINQPYMIYIVFEQVTHTIFDNIISGTASGQLRFSQADPSPSIVINAGAQFGTTGLNTATMAVVRIKINGVNSAIQVNNTAATTGNAGTNIIEGIWLGVRRSNSDRYANIRVRELIIRSKIDSAGDEDMLYRWLVQNNGL